MNSKLLFFSNFLKNPKEVAAISPSSKHVINKVIENIDFVKSKCIVEYGPGVGTITKPILENLNGDAKLICFETNPKFCSFLDKHFEDSRLIVINDSAENIDSYLKEFDIIGVDYILSGIPFSLINRENKKNIIKNTESNLIKGGKFIVYQQYNSHLKEYLNLYFKKVTKSFEVRNIPPTSIFVCEKI